MKKIIFILVIQAIFLNACKQRGGTDGQEKLKAVLNGYFEGIAKKDYQKMKDLTTDDFLLFEDGKIFNNDSLINMVGNFKKFTATYAFDNFRINVDDSVGNMSYFDHGEFTINDTIHLTFNWLESASFKKIGDKWKLAFLHSTIRKY
jgi:hypothetical protein